MPMVVLATMTAALLSAALMGLAIQRGATCMVAVVDQAVSRRQFGRAFALGEAALWVGGLIAVAQFAGALHFAPRLYAATLWTVGGGMLLGIGAWINRACVFGTVARIGSGQWAYLATPLGFFLGCLVPVATPAAAPGSAPPFAHPGWVVLPFAAIALWRLVEVARAPRPLQHLWHPHRATLLIAITFVTALLTVGLWAYTDALAALAQAMDARIGLRSMMVVALFAGAVFGGWLNRSLEHQRPRAPLILRCLAGGALMGMGTSLVPGSNDGLILIGLPLLQPHAWVAVAVMAASIATALGLTRRAT